MAHTGRLGWQSANADECFDFDMKNTSKVTDFYIQSAYFRGIMSY